MWIQKILNLKWSLCMKKKCEHRHFEFTSVEDIVCAECGDKVSLEVA